MKNTGILRIQAFGARQSSPIEGVLVTVSGNGFTAQRITDETGTAADLSIEAPSCALSLQEDNTIRPYAVVDLTAAKAGFRTVRIQGVQIFAGQVTLAQPEMIPETEEDRDVVNPPIVIPEHSLFTGDGGSGPDPIENCMPRVLSRVIIPKNITVHLGKPAASARNVTVSFRDYIANVASSEVYPTWPEQALRANIHCQISLALNRIYTEWYSSKGYTFNITNSTSYDQYYVHGRTVFDVMVRITDDIFNTYLRKTGTVNPYYSEYCDGKSLFVSFNDGSKIEFALSTLPEVTFGNDKMTVTSTATTASYELWKVSTFTYGTTTGIQQIEANSKFAFEGDRIIMDGTHNQVSAFALDGKAVSLSPILAGDKTIIPLDELTHGVYIIKINNKSIKVARQ